jgi:hypothetical protein
MNKYLVIVSILIIVILSGCDKGIEPGEPNLPGGFSGKVTFIGQWPDSIKRTHLVVFRNPIQRTEDFFLPNLSFVIDSIPYKSAQFTYNSFENDFLSILQLFQGEYKYVVVAQSKTPEISFQRKDWFVVGVYCINNDQSKPKSLFIKSNQVTLDVSIVVNFNNPPPQPPM